MMLSDCVLVDGYYSSMMLFQREVYLGVVEERRECALDAYLIDGGEVTKVLLIVFVVILVGVIFWRLLGKRKWWLGLESTDGDVAFEDVDD